MNTKLVLIGGGVAVAAVAAYVLYRKGGKLLSTTLNPASDQNAVYTGINDAAQTAGLFSKDDTLGTWLYSVFNPSQAATGLPATTDYSQFDGVIGPSESANQAAAANGGWGDIGGWFSNLFGGSSAPVTQTSGAPLSAAADSGPSLTDLTSGQPLDYLFNGSGWTAPLKTGISSGVTYGDGMPGSGGLYR